MIDILDKLWLSRHPYDALFLELIDGYIIKESEYYPNEIFYMKGDRILIKYIQTTKYAHINDNLIWSVFETKFSIKHEETRQLLRGMLETHLNLMGTTPVERMQFSLCRLETHLNLMGTTPLGKYEIGGW